MPGRYIPPALRKPKPTTDPKEPNLTQNENNLPSRALSDLKLQHKDELVTSHDIHRHFWPDGRRSLHGASTLNDSAARPGRLAYVVLFLGAHPGWESDGVVFAKSNLGLLDGVEGGVAMPGVVPGGEGGEERVVDDGAVSAKAEDSDEIIANVSPAERDTTATRTSVEKGAKSIVPNQTEKSPIAIFNQVRKGPRTIKFTGWYEIAKLDRLQPKSPELIRMLEQKWMVKDRYGNVKSRQRDGKAWDESLRHEWVVLKMEPCGGPELLVEHVHEPLPGNGGELIIQEAKTGIVDAEAEAKAEDGEVLKTGAIDFAL
ncbi:MAG: hypothetical protein M1828_003986 [Chrysothrix sp. TS-e1954]|nr:MAG: hypothetical protein M1828_003986 [Chrysothrix sp. TS-e1954]